MVWGKSKLWLSKKNKPYWESEDRGKESREVNGNVKIKGVKVWGNWRITATFVYGEMASREKEGKLDMISKS